MIETPDLGPPEAWACGTGCRTPDQSTTVQRIGLAARLVLDLLEMNVCFPRFDL